MGNREKEHKLQDGKIEPTHQDRLNGLFATNHHNKLLGKDDGT